MIPSPRRTAVRTGLAAGLLAVAVALAGCTPGPDPKPSPTPLFTSEADAFKAAEQVYREYVDALNSRNAGDAGARPQDLLGGKALEFDTNSVRNRKAEGTTVSGDTRVLSFEGVDSVMRPPTALVRGKVCIDVSETRLLNAGGQDITPADRKPRVELAIEFAQEKRSLIITDSQMAADHC
ncbi:hypothetical protein [Microbacterium capsulatum]|uniref:Lipoprotein n=1 Tax=Microbacterium capsulatum TaxID=3041921 RepID=A0ABU0XMX7_9MICO|nr:hypothetical protein [Microbacterium sp. ASV81]MDQ4215090.1 hypothetical protein [Microbacterium sp. ASV81]